MIAVPRGNRVTAYLAVRRDGFAGPVTLTPGELPAGVKVDISADPGRRVPRCRSCSRPPPTPRSAGKLVELTRNGGDATVPVTGGFTQVVTLIRGPGDSAFHAVDAVEAGGRGRGRVAVHRQRRPAGRRRSSADGTLDVTVEGRRGRRTSRSRSR